MSANQFELEDIESEIQNRLSSLYDRTEKMPKETIRKEIRGLSSLFNELIMLDRQF